MSDNAANFRARRLRVRQTREPAALVLSDGALRTAYAAGTLLGWAETGYRPEFDVVTAVGPSILIAPFAFLGRAGDQSIANIFSCAANGWTDLADRAAGMLTADVLTAIASQHRAGKRLLVALKGNAARPSAYWDVGWIATNNPPQEVVRRMRAIFRAAVVMHQFPDTGAMPRAAGARLARNRAFREIGSGRAMLMTPNLRTSTRSLYIIHNDVILPDERASFLAKMAKSKTHAASKNQNSSLRTIYDLKTLADRLGKYHRVAKVAPRKWFFPKGVFDQSYMMDVFVRSHRAARMGRLWKSEHMR